jgi:nitroimidazol reductase NimA-like FMN-containing flavoprotein (pyridoxamine 5'-phosphate oxidase superfamily)
VGEDREARCRLRDLLGSQKFAVLSTQSETGPYSSLVAFWAADDLASIVFPTMRETRKFNYLVSHPRVALLFDDRSNRDSDLSRTVAVTATGTAREVSDDTGRALASAGFLAKHPHLAAFAADPGCALIRVTIDTYYVVTDFQQLVTLHVTGPAAGAEH